MIDAVVVSNCLRGANTGARLLRDGMKTTEKELPSSANCERADCEGHSSDEPKWRAPSASEQDEENCRDALDAMLGDAAGFPHASHLQSTELRTGRLLRWP